MKFFPLIVISCFVFLFTSCLSQLNLEKRKYRPGYFLQNNFTIQNENNSKSIESKIIRTESDKILFDNIYQSKNNPDTIPPRTDSSKVLTLSPKVGDVIDSAEKAKYHLFSYWESDQFLSAQFIQQPDGKIIAVGKMKDGSDGKMPFTKEHYENLAKSFEIEQELVKSEKDTLTTEHKIEIDMLDALDSTAAQKSANHAILWFCFLWVLLIPLIPAGACAVTALRHGLRVTHRHEKHEDYPAKKRAKYAVGIGITGLVLEVLFIGLGIGLVTGGAIILGVIILVPAFILFAGSISAITENKREK